MYEAEDLRTAQRMLLSWLAVRGQRAMPMWLIEEAEELIDNGDLPFGKEESPNVS